MDNKAYIHDEEQHQPEKHKKEEEDPWKVTSLKQDFVPWSKLNSKQRALRLLGYFVKVVLVLGFLYLFVCSLDFLSSAFRLLGGEAAGRVFQQNDIMTNPVAGLMMGVLVTVLVQSSSTSTSIIVSMVGADLLEIKTAIPIIMGANIGTSVTNTIVAIGQINDKGEFRRAFAGATVHDMFNWLTVIVLLPLEVATDYLYHLSDAIVGTLDLETNENGDKEILKVITKPFTDKIIQINKKAITNIAKNVDVKYEYDRTVLKICCDKTTRDKCSNKQFEKYDEHKYVTIPNSVKDEFCLGLTSCAEDLSGYNGTLSRCASIPWKNTEVDKGTQSIKCQSLFSNSTYSTCCKNVVDQYIIDTHVDTRNWTTACSQVLSSSCVSGSNVSMTDCRNNVGNVSREVFDSYKWTTGVINSTCKDTCDFLFRDMHPDLDDKPIGAILLVISLLLLCICLVAIVKLLHSILQGPIATMIKKFVNAEFPGPLAYFTGYLAILIGAGLTFVVQSSSIFTSTLTPLVGIGVIELDRMYPLTLGSNIGTTTTAILSALASDAEHLRDTLQVAFCHLFFNITGILIFYPITYLRFPIPLAKFLGNQTADYRWFAIVYILIMFFAFPAVIFALSIPGWYVLLGVAGPFVFIAIVVVIIKIIQAKRPGILPAKMRNWRWLPKALRSLEPYDRGMQKLFFCTRFQQEQDSKEQNKGMTNLYNHNSKSGASNGNMHTRL